MKKILYLFSLLCANSFAVVPDSFMESLVGIGQGITINNPDTNDSLYTFGCGPSICLLIDTESGSNKMVTLMHLQPDYPTGAFAAKITELLKPYNNLDAKLRITLVSSGEDLSKIEQIENSILKQLDNSPFEKSDIKYHNNTAMVYYNGNIEVMTDNAYSNNNYPMFTISDLDFQTQHKTELIFFKKMFSPTRNDSSGFNEREMYKIFSSFKDAMDLESMVANLGYKYKGNVAIESKNSNAYTLHNKYGIWINKSRSPELAALSYIYELSNANQHEAFINGPSKLWNSNLNDISTAKKYAEEVMELEANSILMRSKMAIALNRPDLVKNQTYNQIAAETVLSDKERTEKIYQEMKENGIVQGKSVYLHYFEQFINRKTNDKI